MTERDKQQPETLDQDRTPEATGQGEQEQRPQEIGGRKGPEPTRYGDWEKGGRCIDF